MEMIHCPNCGDSIGEDEMICPFCDELVYGPGSVSDGSEEEFREMLAGFLKRSPEHEKLVARLFGVSLPVVKGWADGLITLPSKRLSSGLENLTAFIREHKCACGA